MIKTAVLLGTSRYEGNTRQLITQVGTSMNIELFMLKDYDITPFDYDHKNRDDDFIPLVKQLLEYDHIVFASPLYWYTMSAQLKVFFDRISDLLGIEKDIGRQLRGKHCSLLSTGVDDLPPNCLEETFKLTFDYLDMCYHGMIYCSIKEDYIAAQFDDQVSEFVKVINLT
jgi:multimeric flavodoxin WrbA